MSDNEQRWRLNLPPEVGCAGKVAFESLKHVNEALNRNARTKRPRRSGYRCPWCHKWHLGTDAGRVKKRKAAELRRNRHEPIED